MTLHGHQSRNPTHPVLLALVAVGVVAAAATIGNLATMPNIPTWYAQLRKPGFTPPNWVFGPVWTTLYVMMAIAFWRILRLAPGTPGRGAAIGVFLVQMVLNAAWSVAFFGLHSPVLGMLVILALEAAILVTIARFLRLDRLAGWLLVPYAAWVAYATALNAAVMLLNR